MDASVEVRYAGVVVGRGVLVRDLGAEGAFVALSEPLPVGTTVTLKIDDVARSAIVEEVVESAEPSTAGMRVRWGADVSTPRPRSTPAASEPAPAGSPVVVEVAAEYGSSGSSDSSSSGATPAVATEDDVSEAIPAPLSLAGAGGQTSPGGGKKRRKRR